MKFTRGLFKKNDLDTVSDADVQDAQPAISVKLGGNEPTTVDAEHVEFVSTESEEMATKPKGFFRRGKKQTKAATADVVGGSAKGPVIPPTALWIGFLPEVTERDAKTYALGIAEKHNVAIALSYYDVFKYNQGFVYEVQEGGSQKAYTPEILKYFDSMPRSEQGDAIPLVSIKTAKRVVQVERTQEGLTAIQLPESSTQKPTDWLVPKLKMMPVMPTLDKFLTASAFFFGLTFLGMVAANLGRVQPYEAPLDSPIIKAQYQDTPSAQWRRVVSVSGNEYVRALRFKDGKWEVDTGRIGAPAIPTTEAPTEAVTSEAPGAQ